MAKSQVAMQQCTERDAKFVFSFTQVTNFTSLYIVPSVFKQRFSWGKISQLGFFMLKCAFANNL